MRTYLLILFILFTKFWNIKPIAYISQNVYIIILAMYMLWGCYIFRKRKRTYIRDKYTYLKWIGFGMILSMCSAYLFYNQSLLQSILTYKAQYILFIAIYTLFKISPKLEDVVEVLYKFGIIIIFINILMNYDHNLFVIKEKTLEYTLNQENGIFTAIQGIIYLTIPLFFYLQKLKENIETKTVIRIIVLSAAIFIAQNRSTLFSVAVLSIYPIMYLKSRYKPFIITIIAIGIVFFAMQTLDIWAELIDETITQINNEDYNRNKALYYYIFEASPHWICYIIGNGYISANTSSIMQTLMDNGIVNGDVGFIGYWNHFGIIPVLAILTMFFKTLKGKYPLYLKLTVLQILICFLTTTYYGQIANMPQLILFYYLFFNERHRKIIIKNSTYIKYC